MQDGLPEQVPGTELTGVTVQIAGGNYVVVRIGRGQFALYAHLQPGSPRVEVGDRVRAGQVLGLLGNTGNSDGPHLHFHIMDSPSPLRSSGVPFTFSKFTVEGLVTDIVPAFSTGSAVVESTPLDGVHRRQMPLDSQLVAFD